MDKPFISNLSRLPGWLCLGLLVICIVSVSAQQQLPQVVPPSPTSVQFQRFGDYPAAGYTGIPDITIPLYTITEGDITVPVTLSFHASGWRPYEQFGPTGRGWTLNTGGMVSRQINGLPDDASPMFIPDARQSIQPLPNFPNHPYYTLKSLHENQYYDEEYDLFSYSVLGRSGKFIMNPDLNNPGIFPLKEDNMEIIYPTVLRDENGIGYFFGGTNMEEYQEYHQGGNSWTAVGTWHLQNIQSARYPGRGVSYTYQTGQTFSLVGNNWQSTWDYNWDFIYQESDNIPYRLESNNNHWSNNYSTYSYNTRFPQKISFSAGYLMFYLSPQKQLDSINVFDKKGQRLRQIAFQYGSGINQSASNLHSVILRDKDKAQVEKYSFDYYGEASSYTGGTDHWGFANGSSEQGLIPVTEGVHNDAFGLVYTNVGGNANLNAVSSVALINTLKRITYPTGGFTEFDYEGNRNMMNQETGGLRVTSIRTYKDGGPPVPDRRKDYSYVSFSQEISPDPSLYRRENLVHVNQINRTFDRLFINQSTTVSLAPQGSSVFYSYVTETEGERSTQYYYDNDEAYQYERMTAPATTSPYGRLFAHYYKPWNFGNLLSRASEGPGFYHAEGFGYETVLQDTIHDFLIEREVSTHCTIPNCTSEGSMAETFGIDYFNYANRYHIRGGKRLKAKTLTYDGVYTETRYEYDNPSYPMVATRIAVNTSKVDSTTSYMKYAFDYNTPPYTAMTAFNMISPVIEEKKYRKSDGAFLDAVQTDWKYWENDVIAPELVKTKTGSESNVYNTRIRYKAYSPEGNVTGVSKERGAELSYLWDQQGLNPIAEIKNAPVNEVYHTSFEEGTGFDGAMEQDLTHVHTGDYSGKIVNSGTGEKVSHCNSWLKVSLSNARRFKYSGWVYSNGPGAEIVLFMKRHGETAYFSYVDAVPTTKINQWEYIEKEYLVPADVTQLSLRADNNSAGTVWFDDLRLHPSVAQMSTYTYKSLVGMSSVTDARNQSTYFEYDSYQRLKLVRDQDGNVLKQTQYHYKP